MILHLADIKSKLNEQHTYLPVARAIDLKHSQWFSLYKGLTKNETFHVLLESGRAGRYSFIAHRPTHHLIGKNQQLTIKEINEQGHYTQEESYVGPILHSLKNWMADKKAPSFAELPDFNGGLLGFYSYDLVREIEHLESTSKDDLATPDVSLLAFEQVLIYDHQLNQHFVVIYQRVVDQDIELSYELGKQRLEKWTTEIYNLVDTLPPTVEQGTDSPVRVDQSSLSEEYIERSFSEAEFVEAVQKVQKYIAAGDVFQINLSVRQTRNLTVQPIEIYEELRRINPSPYMGFLSFPDRQIISGSPEQLIKMKGSEVNTRPIAGTRPRGTNREEDLALANELINNEKERAEHVMLVDLERNDLGKVCQFGTVEVNEFMVIEEYSHVMHIVSNVRGTLAEGNDAFDVIRATFPGGTITGAPKVRTMEIIEELELVRRGIYTGSIGWIDFNGDMELNIVIRTIVAQEGKAHVQAGAGIVIDSIPVNEYKESLKKAEALWRAFEASEKKKKEIRV